MFENFQKHLYQFLLILLTLGASLIIGLLSFSGIYVILPSLLLGATFFTLSTIYEAQILGENIDGALQKLFSADRLEYDLSLQYLLDSFRTLDPNLQEKWPSFYIDFAEELMTYDQLHHTPNGAETRRLRKESEEKLKEKLTFFHQIITQKRKDDPALIEHLNISAPNQVSFIEQFQTHFSRNKPFQFAAKIFSAMTMALMTLGTTYLLTEAFLTIPFFASLSVAFWPILILPMAVISAAAFASLTYNTLSNIITHHKIQKRFLAFKEDIQKNGLHAKNIIPLAITAILTTLAALLTICTAGTWLTIAKETPAIIRGMRHIPSFVMNVLLPLFTGIAALAFNLENSNESLETLEKIFSKETLNKIIQSIQLTIKTIRESENWLQLFNPFRIILLLTITPLRFLLFIGHLMSIGATADRVPGVSKIGSAIMGFICEFFEDMHYFIQCDTHSHDLFPLLEEYLSGDAHSHEKDIPTRIIKLISTPIYFASLLWDYTASQRNVPEQKLKFNWVIYKTCYRVFGDYTPEWIEKLIHIEVKPPIFEPAAASSSIDIEMVERSSSPTNDFEEKILLEKPKNRTYPNSRLFSFAQQRKCLDPNCSISHNSFFNKVQYCLPLEVNENDQDSLVDLFADNPNMSFSEVK